MPPLPSPAERCACACADAELEASYPRVLGGRKADLLLTDPPYCLLTRRRRGGDLRDPRPRKIDRDPVVRFETVRSYREFTRRWLGAATAHLRPAATLVLWTNFLGKEPLLSTAAELGYPHLAGEFTWAKRTTDRQGNEQLLRVYEVALVLCPSPPKPPGPEAPALPWAVVAGYDDEGQADQHGAHPHHKPFGVLEPLLRTWSRPGELVLDPFAGSGSIPEAALRLGRRVACLEKEPRWASLVADRLRAIPPGPLPE